MLEPVRSQHLIIPEPNWWEDRKKLFLISGAMVVAPNPT
jgi:hypothetical protein